MKSRCYQRLREQVFTERLENGLNVFVVRKPSFNKSYAFFAANYGAVDRRFALRGKWLDTPAGVAHFLEHKMFDTETGNALSELSANGASPNAFTSMDMTAYHFECIDKFEDNLEILLKFVSVPYFTPESVAKEQGIIGQEIRMTEDDPDYVVYYGLMKALYDHHPLRDPVAGTVESIAQITAKTLYDCHSAFYSPVNMVLCVAGEVDPDRVASIARNVLPKQPGEVPGRDYGAAEPLSPIITLSERQMEVSMPLFMAGAKSPPPEPGPGFLRQEVVGGLAMEVLAGRSSPLFLRLYAEGLVNMNFTAAFEQTALAAYSIIGGESPAPEKVFEAIREESLNLARRGPDPELFKRIKKAVFGRQIRSLNSLETTCYSVARGCFKGYDAFEITEVIDGVSPDDIVAFARESLLPDNMALSVVRPVRDARAGISNTP